jgi:hypothetical protein
MFLFALTDLQGASPPAPACLHRTLDDCVDALRKHMTIDEAAVARSKESFGRVDVNGHPLRDEANISFSVTLTGRLWATPVHVRLDDGSLVREISFDLYAVPLLAQTAEEYDRTGLYDFTNAILDRANCPDAERMPLYRFFQNVVKPTISHSALKGSEMNESTVLPLCGVKFQYNDLVGHSRSVSSKSNRGGAYGGATIIFDDDGKPTRS